jgi:putative DNA primase/helicase
MTEYPDGFSDWPVEQRNAFFRAEATRYRERQADLSRPAGGQYRSTLAGANGSDKLADSLGRRNGTTSDSGSSVSAVKPSVALIRGDNIKPKPIGWLWRGWLARGKMHILGGAPGTGKTTIGLSLAAIVTQGGVWPDGSRCPGQGQVVIWSGEDDPADTLVPRLMAAGADMAHVHFVDDVHVGGEARSFDPARDIEPLRDAIKRAGGADLLIVDPVVSAVVGDSHKNSETRRALQPLVDLTSALGAALIGVTHFSKGTSGRDPIERLTGSLAFGALARIVMVAAKCQRKQDGAQAERILCRAKSNIGEDNGGFTYELRQSELTPGIAASTVTFAKAVDGTAREILREAEAVETVAEHGQVGAEHFLIEFLAEGAKTVAEVREAVKAHCLAWRTVERAKSKLGIRATRKGFGEDGGWQWEIPDTFNRPPHCSIDRQQDC